MDDPHHPSHHRAMRAIAQRLHAPELTGEHYQRCNQVFRSLTNQQQVMLDWSIQQLGDSHSLRSASKQKPLSILSVGCGCGMFEIPLIQRIQQHFPTQKIHFTGIDPNPKECQTIQQAMATVPDVDTHIYNCRFDDYNKTQHFDLILFVHSLYYLKSINSALSKAVKLLNRKAKILLFSAEQGGINTAAQAFRSSTADYIFQDQLDQWLVKQTLGVSSKRLNASIDPSGIQSKPCTNQYHDFLSFLAQKDLREHLNDHCLATMENWLQEEREPENGYLSHPVWAYEIRNTQAIRSQNKFRATTAQPA